MPRHFQAIEPAAQAASSSMSLSGTSLSGLSYSAPSISQPSMPSIVSLFFGYAPDHKNTDTDAQNLNLD